MKGHELLEAVGGIHEKYIHNAGTTKTKREQISYKWIVAAAACLCVIAAVGIAAPRTANRDRTIGENPQAEDPVTGAGNPGGWDPVAAAGNPEGKTGTEENVQTDKIAEGVYVPAIVLPDRDDTMAADMVGLIVYQGRIYTQTVNYLGEDAQRIETLVGEYLGTAKGNIDEWSSQDEYAVEFASTTSGEVYSVNGYEDGFRICVKGEVEDENHNRVLWIQFYDCLNGIMLTTGQDLFQERLHITERTERVQWQSHEDWNNEAFGNIQNAEVGEDIWEEFWNAVNACSFINTWSPDHSTSDPASDNKSVYDNPNQAHLILTMNDGTVVRIRLFEGGYVGYEPLGWYFVKIPEDVFNPLYEACGGSH